MRGQSTRRDFSASLPVLLGTTVIGALCGPVATGRAQSSIAGTWYLDWQGARDHYTGTLRIANRIDAHLYQGTLRLLKSNGTVVTEDANITVNGNEVRVECSRPSVKPWNPDRFYLTIDGDRLEGYSLDTAGQRGSKIAFTRR